MNDRPSIERIVLLSCDFLPVVGGVSTMVHHVANALQASGIQVRVIAPKRPGTHPFEQAYEVIYHDLPVVTLENVINHLFFEPSQLRRIADQFIAPFQPDAVILGHAYRYDSIAMHCCRQNQVVLGTMTHGAELATVSNRYRQTSSVDGTVANRLFKWFSKRSLQRRCQRLLSSSDVVFANSQFTASLAQSMGAKRVCVTGCGVEQTVPGSVEMDGDVDDKAPVDQAEKHNIKSRLGLAESPLVGTIARLVPSKNVICLIDAVRALPDAQLVIIGDGKQRQELERHVNQNGLQTRVRFAGRVSEHQKWDYLRAMDVFCLPSIELPNGEYEGFGIVLLEAANVGTPVIAANSGGMTDIVQSNHTGLLFDPSDSTDLARCIKRFLDDSDLGARTNRKLRQAITERFNWDAIASKMVSELRSADPR